MKQKDRRQAWTHSQGTRMEREPDVRHLATDLARARELRLPDWILEEAHVDAVADPEERLRFVLRLARCNVERATGGPFAAAVFEEGTGQLVSVGVNCVVPASASPAHAEVMALLLAQGRLGTHDLGGRDGIAHQLVSSAQPCLMCLGAVMWSGIGRLVYGATRVDVERVLGFDEGPLPRRWVGELRRRGVVVAGGVLRKEARAVLELYRELGGVVYNPHRGARIHSG